MSDPSPDLLRGRTIAVTGASGNLGTALLRRLTDPATGVAQVRGLVRRRPPDVAPYDGVDWHLADLGEAASEEPLARFVDGADAVVHLGWAIQPGRQAARLHRVNVEGTRRVVRAAAAAGVAQFVHMSSLGAYAPAEIGQVVAEDWPTTGIPTSQYSRDKSDAERVVREVAARYPDMTLAVARPTLVLQPDAASEIGRYFLGPLLLEAARRLPGGLAARLPLPLPSASVAFVHSDDVADALVLMLRQRAAGPFNLAADPLMSADEIAHALGTWRLPVPALLMRTGLQAAFLTRVVPTEPGWLDLGLHAPAIDSTRARTVLGWQPAHRGDDVLREFVAALGRGDGGTGPLLHSAEN